LDYYFVEKKIIMANEGNKGNDFYAVLGLNKECTDSDLRNAYKKLALVRIYNLNTFFFLLLSTLFFHEFYSNGCSQNLIFFFNG
jgi:hypothetical protein